MKTRLIETNQPELAAELLVAGKLVAFPTDTFFALGAVLEDSAIASLFDTKGRMAGHPVPVLLSAAEQVEQVATSFPARARVLAEKFWPGPLTLVLPVRDGVPAAVSAGTGNVGVRVPDHSLAVELIAKTGRPVTGTSANLSGQPPCKTATEVLSQLDGKIDAVVNGECGEHSAPSTVIGLDGNKIRVLRQGSISEDVLKSTLAAVQ